MKKYIIAFGLFCLSLFLIDNAYAVTGNNWVVSIKHPLMAFLNTCSNSTTCNTSKTLYTVDISNYLGSIDGESIDFLYGGSVFYSDQFSMPTNGLAFTYNTGTAFKKGYVYVQNTYVCLNNTSTYFELDDYGLSTGSDYKNTGVKAIYNTSNILSSSNFIFADNPRCQYITTVFESTIDAKTYSIKLDTTKGVSTRYHLLGYETTILGQADLVTNETLQKAINGSGLATAKSVEDVQKSTEELKQDVQKQTEQQKKDHKETMDTITNEDAPDSSEYGNVSGWLPSGTIDTLINLPLSMLTSINNSATATCSPYQLPFINNTTLTLPCVGNYLENLDGFGTIISSIDLLMSVFLLYKLLMSLYKDIQKHLELKNTDSDLGGIE